MDRATAAEATRARKALNRCAADAASLLNYHVKRHRVPPAWAVGRMERLPSYLAAPVRERLEGRLGRAAKPLR